MDTRHSTKTDALELAQPIVGPNNNVIGIIKVILGAHAIHSIIGSFQAGHSATAVLLRANGEVIAAGSDSIANQESYPAILEIIDARSTGIRYFISNTSPEAIYGLSGASFKRLYQKLDWLIATTGSISDVLGPLPRLRTYFVVFILAIIKLCLIASALVSHLESKPVMGEDPHLEKL